MRFRRLFRNIPILAALAVALAGAPARAGDNDVVPYWLPMLRPTRPSRRAR